MDNIYKKLLQVQSKLKAPKGQRNKFGNYNYRSCEDILEAVKPLLKEYGLVQIIQDSIKCIDGWHYVQSHIILFDADSDPKTGVSCLESTGMAREPETKKGMDAAQITGATSSYARKYALNGLYAIDDTKDGDSTENKKECDSKFKDFKDQIINDLKKVKTLDELTNFKAELTSKNQYTKEIQTLFTKRSKELK